MMLHPYAIACGMSLVIASVQAATPDAAKQVASGLSKQKSRDFAGAASDFSAAAKLSPDEPRVTYDKECALAAQGEYDEAEQYWSLQLACSERGQVGESRSQVIHFP